MANKQNFKPDEWTKILESTMLAGMAVSAAEPSGLWGALKEAFASSSALAAAKSDAGSNELIKAVVADFETKEGRSAVQEALRKQLAGAKPAEAVQRSLANLREVSAVLDAKAPQDAAGFKTWLRTISQNVAEASAEGGLLGITPLRLWQKATSPPSVILRPGISKPIGPWNDENHSDSLFLSPLLPCTAEEARDRKLGRPARNRSSPR
jgi:hypothetical protein